MKTAIAVFLLGLVLLASGCPKRVTIGDIEANPDKYRDKEVAIAGTVQTSYGVSLPIGRSGGIYKVSDGTGSIWVITQDAVPSKGAEIGIKGKIQNGVTYNGKNYGLVLMEDDRRFRKR